MNLSIGHRLFLLALLSLVLMTMAGVGLVRWALFDPAAGEATAREADTLGGLRDTLSADYRRNGGWSFLPAAAPARARWLRDALARTTPSRSPSLAYRLVLLDADGRPLAGTMPRPATVALASIDSVRRPILVDAARVGDLLVLKPSPADDGLATAFLVAHQRDLLTVAALGLALALFAAVLMAANVRGPVRRLVAAAHAVEAGRFDAPLDLRRGDEFGVLSRTFDRLSRRLEETQRMRRRWIAETSHELRTPLAVLRGQVESLEDGIRAPTPEHLALMSRQVRTLTRIVDDLHTLAAADAGRLSLDLQRVDIASAAHEVFADFEARFRAAGLTAELGDTRPDAYVRCDRERLRQVLANLFENSVRYTTAGGRVEVRIEAADGAWRLVIDDSTPGVPAPVRARLGERDFRPGEGPDVVRGGTGLGLALCRRLIEAQGGRLTFDASPLGGLRAIVGLPREDAA